MEDHPNYRYMKNVGHGADPEIHSDEEWAQYIVPFSFTSGLFTSEFWEHRYSTYGLQAFQVPQALQQKRKYRRATLGIPKRCTQRYVTDEIREEIEQFRAVTKTWQPNRDRLRPWYDPPHKRTRSDPLRESLIPPPNLPSPEVD